MERTIKRTKRGEGKTVKAYTFYIDLELLPYLNEQPNKNRWINEAIRMRCKKPLE